jgi:chromosome segregation ATPase
LQESEAYKSWWQLHLRYAKGETLTPSESETYHAFRTRLERDEAQEISVLLPTENFQERLTVAEERLRQLQQKRRALSARIATLERRYGTLQTRTRSATV